MNGHTCLQSAAGEWTKLVSTKVSRHIKIVISLETVPKEPTIPKLLGHAMSIFAETVPKKPKKPKIPESLRNWKWAYFSRQSQKNKAHKLEMSIFFETVPKKPKIPKLLGHETSIFLETVPKKSKKPKIQSYSKSHGPMQLQWLGNFGFFGFFGTVSRNMLISWPRSFGTFGFFWTVSKNMLISSLWALFFWDCLEKYAHFRCRRGSGIFGFLFFLGLSREICSLRSLGVLFSLVFFGTVSRNMLISWRMGFVLWLFEIVSRNVILSWPLASCHSHTQACYISRTVVCYMYAYTTRRTVPYRLTGQKHKQATTQHKQT